MQNGDAILKLLNMIAENCPYLATIVSEKNENYRTLIEKALPQIDEDLHAYCRSDPAQALVPGGLLTCHSPFVAIALHRIAHKLWTCSNSLDENVIEQRRRAVAIAQFARVSTAVEIHPGAAIGHRFVVDHGFGTVIGETVRIGDDCYILNGVTLGARGIANNPTGKRHPTLGNRVQVGAFVRVFGPVKIGNDAFIGSLACITRDVPDGAFIPGLTRAVDDEPISAHRGGLKACLNPLG